MTNLSTTVLAQEEITSLSFEEIQNAFCASDVNRLIQDAMEDLLSHFGSQEEVEAHLVALYQWDADCAAIVSEELNEADVSVLISDQTPFFFEEIIESDPMDSWLDIESSSAKSLRYDSETEYLDIQYRSNEDGYFYRYFDVPQDLFDFVLRIKDEGGSVGSFIAKNIRNEYDNALLAA